MNYKLNIKHWFINLLICLLGYLFIGLFVPQLQAQTPVQAPISQKTAAVELSASVGKYILSLSGIIAPNASISLIGNASGSSTPIKATTADSTGKFTIPNILVATGFSKICFDAIDVKRLGESYTCISLTPVTKNTSINGIFLPPTTGLEKNQINQGDSLLVRGYSMPQAQVTVHLSDGRVVSVTSDKDGFYQLNIPMPKAGRYELFAAATYQTQQSLTPTRQKSFLVLNFSQQLANFLKTLISPPLVWIWPILAVIILIIILLRKLKPEVFNRIVSWFKLIFPFRKKKKVKKPLEHDWML